MHIYGVAMVWYGVAYKRGVYVLRVFHQKIICHSTALCVWRGMLSLFSRVRLAVPLRRSRSHRALVYSRPKIWNCCVNTCGFQQKPINMIDRLFPPHSRILVFLGLIFIFTVFHRKVFVWAGAFWQFSGRRDQHSFIIRNSTRIPSTYIMDGRYWVKLIWK